MQNSVILETSKNFKPDWWGNEADLQERRLNVVFITEKYVKGTKFAT